MKVQELKQLIYQGEKETHIFIENSFREGELKTMSTDIDAIMPAVSGYVIYIL